MPIHSAPANAVTLCRPKSSGVLPTDLEISCNYYIWAFCCMVYVDRIRKAYGEMDMIIAVALLRFIVSSQFMSWPTHGFGGFLGTGLGVFPGQRFCSARHGPGGLSSLLPGVAPQLSSADGNVAASIPVLTLTGDTLVQVTGTRGPHPAASPTTALLSRGPGHTPASSQPQQAPQRVTRAVMKHLTESQG